MVFRKSFHPCALDVNSLSIGSINKYIFAWFYLQDKTQMTMIVTWLIEIYLNQLGQLKEEGQDMSSSYDALQEEFRKFLAQTRVKVRARI